MALYQNGSKRPPEHLSRRLRPAAERARISAVRFSRLWGSPTRRTPEESPNTLRVQPIPQPSGKGRFGGDNEAL
jgi:hypothetical protein